MTIEHFKFVGGPATGGSYPVPAGRVEIESATDYDLDRAMASPSGEVAAEWRRRYPIRPVGNKGWAQSAHRLAWGGRQDEAPRLEVDEATDRQLATRIQLATQGESGGPLGWVGEDEVTAEWRRRYPIRPVGSKRWAQRAHTAAWEDK